MTFYDSLIFFSLSQKLSIKLHDPPPSFDHYKIPLWICYYIAEALVIIPISISHLHECQDGDRNLQHTILLKYKPVDFIRCEVSFVFLVHFFFPDVENEHNYIMTKALKSYKLHRDKEKAETRQRQLRSAYRRRWHAPVVPSKLRANSASHVRPRTVTDVIREVEVANTEERYSNDESSWRHKLPLYSVYLVLLPISEQLSFLWCYYEHQTKELRSEHQMFLRIINRG